MHQQHPDLLQLAGLVVSAFRYFPLCCCPTSNDHKSCDPSLWFFLSLFRKASTGDGPREGELEDLHEDEPSSWVPATLLRAQRPLYIHLRLHSHLKVVPQCKRIILHLKHKNSSFFVLFFGEKFVMWRTRLLLRCGAVLSSADVRNTSTSVDHHRFILLASNCITGKDRRVFPIVHGEYLDRIFSLSAATWQEETDLSM